MNLHPLVQKHIEKFDQTIQNRFLEIRAIIFEEIPKVEEKLGYGVPGYYLNGKNILYVSCFKHHIGLYPNAKFIEVYKEDLKKYKTSKGTIQVSHEQNIPYDLIRNICTYKGIDNHD